MLLFLALIVGALLLLFGFTYIADARNRRRTGHTTTIDQSQLRFLDNGPGFSISDQGEKPPGVV